MRDTHLFSRARSEPRSLIEKGSGRNGRGIGRVGRRAGGCWVEPMEPRLFLAGNGLMATYWDNASPTYSSSLNFSGPSVSRVDPTVNFNWGTGSPAAGIAPTTFSARWTGQIDIPTTATYTFYAKTDDGVKLWVNGTQIINNWRNQASAETSGRITLTGGRRYDVRMEYYQNTGQAVAQLRWSSPTIAKAIIPQSVLYSTTIPAAPSGLAVSATSPVQAQLRWTDNANNEDGYAILRSTDGTNFAQVGTAAANATSYLDNGLADGTQYYYRVQAYNVAGTSAIVAAAVLMPLATVTNLTATPAANVPKVTLNWAGSSSSGQGYIIQRSADGTNFAEIARVGMAVTSYTDVGTLAAGSSYTYRVWIFNAAGVSAPSQPAAATTANFHVFDGMLFNGRPDMSAYGMEAIYIAYNGNEGIFASGSAVPNEANTRALARKVADLHQVLCLDIETLPLDIRTTPVAQVQANLAALGQVVDWIHSERPGLKVGFYGLLPLRDYWTPVAYGQDPVTMQAWKDANAALMPLAQKVDILFPSLYTFYDDQAGWQTYAQANLAQAAQYGKPIVPFLWMYYHESNPTLGGTPVPAAYWQMELNFVRQNANGMVIWGGWQTAWDAQAPWWQTTQGFLA